MKLLRGAFVAALTLLVLLVPSSEGAAPVLEAEFGSVSGAPGDTVDIEVRLVENPGYFVLRFGYEADPGLEYMGSRAGDIGSAEPNQFVVWSEADGAYNVEDTGVLAVLSFRIDPSATGDLHVRALFEGDIASEAIMYDPSDETGLTTLDVHITDATVHVEAPSSQSTEYSLTYDANGGNQPPSRQSVHSVSSSVEMVVSSIEPFRNGYAFAGWSYGGSTYHAGDVITLGSSNPSATLSALWARTYTYSVDFDLDGGTGAVYVEPVTTTETSQIFQIPATVPTKAGNSFSGWSYGGRTYQPGDELSLTSSSPTTKLVAQWTADPAESYTYTLSFDANGGSGAPAPISVSVTAQQYTFTIPVGIPTKDGSTFAGWSHAGRTYNPGGSITLTSSSPSATLTASWTDVPSASYTYPLAFDPNGGSGAPSTMTYVSIEGSHTFQIPSTVPVKDGSSFSGWAYGGRTYAQGGSITLTSSSPSVTLTANWEVVPAETYTYKLSFNANGGTGAPSDIVLSSSNASETFTVPSTVPVRQGMSFDGWTYEGKMYHQGDRVTLTSSSPTGEMSAQWSALEPASEGGGFPIVIVLVIVIVIVVLAVLALLLMHRGKNP
ncbi:MAG: InlB B-repeat-containing protein [Candidatus Methanomethylophilaceae archaeon]|nr:InlB B-repeat-containing protein [Candidatus Methanomethylophilaceae archaeon]